MLITDDIRNRWQCLEEWARELKSLADTAWLWRKVANMECELGMKLLRLEVRLSVAIERVAAKFEYCQPSISRMDQIVAELITIASTATKYWRLAEQLGDRGDGIPYSAKRRQRDIRELRDMLVGWQQVIIECIECI